MMDFTSTAYQFSVPILLLLLFFFKKEKYIWLRNAIAASNTVLLFYCLYNSIGIFAIIVDTVKALFSQSEYLGYTFYYTRANLFAPYGFSFYTGLLMELFPLLFLSKKLRNKIWLTVVMLLLLWWVDIWVIIVSWYRDYLPSSWSVYYTNNNSVFQILNYLCLFIVAYAMLWLMKWMPSQQKPKTL